MRSKRRRIAAGTAAATAISSDNNQALAAASASTISAIIFGFAIVLAIAQARAGEFDSILRWRNIGPYRGGRTRAICGVPSQPYGLNEERGVYRSIDGGKTFEKVLYRDENIGASDVQIDPSNPQIVYAALWESREGPWENGVFNGSGGGIFKSVDGGKTWRQLTNGLPDNIVQANLAIAPSAPKTLFAAVKTKTIAKLYRSDDGGETWRGTTDDPRPGLGIGGGDLPVVRFDP